jgi:hypothetical protein
LMLAAIASDSNNGMWFCRWQILTDGDVLIGELALIYAAHNLLIERMQPFQHIISI